MASDHQSSMISQRIRSANEPVQRSPRQYSFLMFQQQTQISAGNCTVDFPAFSHRRPCIGNVPQVMICLTGVLRVHRSGHSGFPAQTNRRAPPNHILHPLLRRMPCLTAKKNPSVYRLRNIRQFHTDFGLASAWKGWYIQQRHPAARFCGDRHSFTASV